MIQQVLSIIAQQLNKDLQLRFALDDEVVSLDNLSNSNAPNDQLEENKIIMTLINVQEEKVKPNLRPGAGVHTNPPINLNLTVLFTACFNDYTTSLNFLSSTIGVFQSKNVFTPQNTPGLSSFIERISAEIVNFDSPDLSSLWSMLGATYQPSVVYKLRVLGTDKKLIDYATPLKNQITANPKL